MIPGGGDVDHATPHCASAWLPEPITMQVASGNRARNAALLARSAMARNTTSTA
jgi:hypothetical protein